MAEGSYTMGPLSPFSLKLPICVEDLVTHQIHASLGPPESTTQMVYRPVRPFLQAHYRDRPTDHTARLHLRT